MYLFCKRNICSELMFLNHFRKSFLWTKRLKLQCIQWVIKIIRFYNGLHRMPQEPHQQMEQNTCWYYAILILHILRFVRGWHAFCSIMHGIKKLFIVLIICHEYWVVTDFLCVLRQLIWCCSQNRMEYNKLAHKICCKNGLRL